MNDKYERLIKAALELNEIVEGVRSERWVSDKTGRRLKDTKEWCEFYLALKSKTEG